MFRLSPLPIIQIFIFKNELIIESFLLTHDEYLDVLLFAYDESFVEMPVSGSVPRNSKPGAHTNGVLKCSRRLYEYSIVFRNA
jgi:hypothetical protein